jgi:hypothetical protein
MNNTVKWTASSGFCFPIGGKCCFYKLFIIFAFNNLKLP